MAENSTVRGSLSAKSVEMMTANLVGSLYSNGDLGFGLGFEIVTDLVGRPGSVGQYSWGSAYSELHDHTTCTWTSTWT